VATAAAAAATTAATTATATADEVDVAAKVWGRPDEWSRVSSPTNK
jgi:hypothetical protein